MTPAERLALARENMADAALYQGAGLGNKVVATKLYHTIMSCLFALMNIPVVGDLTHADVIDRFERQYVRRGMFSEGLLRVIRRAYDLTHECDCDHMPVPTDREIEDVMKAAARLIETTEGKLMTDSRKEVMAA